MRIKMILFLAKLKNICLQNNLITKMRIQKLCFLAIITISLLFIGRDGKAQSEVVLVKFESYHFNVRGICYLSK
jgi:hypothetical protein